MSVNDYDEGFYYEIEDLVDEGILDATSPAYGVAKQVLHQGYESLTPKQKSVYDKIFVPMLEKRQWDLKVQEIHNSNPE